MSKRPFKLITKAVPVAYDGNANPTSWRITFAWMTSVVSARGRYWGPLFMGEVPFEVKSRDEANHMRLVLRRYTERTGKLPQIGRPFQEWRHA